MKTRMNKDLRFLTAFCKAVLGESPWPANVYEARKIAQRILEEDEYGTKEALLKHIKEVKE